MKIFNYVISFVIKVSMIAITAVASMAIAENTQAEYRVYQYYVRNRTQQVQDPNSYLVTSTLDPVGYQSYSGGKTTLEIHFLRTWICPGYTGLNKPYCQGPYEKFLKSKIKNQTSEKDQGQSQDQDQNQDQGKATN